MYTLQTEYIYIELHVRNIDKKEGGGREGLRNIRQMKVVKPLWSSGVTISIDKFVLVQTMSATIPKH